MLSFKSDARRRAYKVAFLAPIVLLVCVSASTAAPPIVPPTSPLLLSTLEFAEVSGAYNRANLHDTYFATCASTLEIGTSSGDWGHCQAGTSTRSAKAILVVYCDGSDASCTATDGTSHAYLYDCSSCGWGSSFAYYYVEFADGVPGAQDSNIATQQGHSVYQAGGAIGQTVVQNELDIWPSGYYEDGAEMWTYQSMLRRSQFALLAIVFSGCIAAPSSLVYPDIHSFGEARLQVVLLNSDATLDGDAASYSGYSVVSELGSPSFFLDARNRTVWIGEPDAVWEGCGATAVILVVESRASPLANMTSNRHAFQRALGTTVVVNGLPLGVRVLSEKSAQLKVETVSRFGDVLTIRAGEPGVHLDARLTIAEIGRTGPSSYRVVDVPYHVDIRATYLGEFDVKILPEVVEAYSDGQHLRDYYNDHAEDETPACRDS